MIGKLVLPKKEIQTECQISTISERCHFLDIATLKPQKVKQILKTSENIYELQIKLFVVFIAW